MVVVDKRRYLIVSTAGYFFGASVQHDEEDVEDREILDRFLEQSSCRILCARPVDADRKQVRLKLTTELGADTANSLVFFKMTAAVITEENFHKVVQVASTGCGDGSVLIEGLRQVWAPTLRSSGLSASCLRKLEERLLSSGFSTTVAEEEELWRRKRDEVKRSHERAICEEAVKSAKNIRVELESAAVSRDGLIAVEEACEAISVFVDDLWKLGGPAYTEERMKSFLDVIGNEVVQLTQNYLNAVDITDSRAKDETIALGATVCEKWVNATQKLTELFWPHYSLHPWRGAIFVPGKCSKLGKSLRQMSDLRAQHRQLIRLLTSNERSGLGVEKLLQTFDDTRVALGDDEHWDDEWDRLRRKIEEGLVPAEERVAQKLKGHIADADTPSALVAEFGKYRELMKREGLKRALRGERESLLAAYPDLIENRLAGPDTEDLLDVPRVLQEVQAARSAEVRLESLAKLGKELLADLPGYEEAATRLSSALKEAEEKRRDLVESWVNNTKNEIARKELSLGTDSPVVELTGTSMMRVTYDPRLMTLIREARALSGEGVELPREIRELVDRAASLAGRARALQQVATFHNTIGDRMVPSQRPLMLTVALELARAVQEQSGVVWSDPHLVDAYTARLKELVVKFARQNSELISKHSTLRDYVSNLLKGDAVHLVGNQNIWKETLTSMRAIVDAVDSEYGNAKAWKLHWDRQLLKALGVAYRNALPSLSRKLSEIRVELTFRDGLLQWRPPLEDIRAKLYSGIRRSLSIPVNFRGVGDVADAHFGDLVQKNAYLFSGVYKQVEVALATLELFRMKWLSLATPANIDVGERLKGKPPQEWAKAFKEAKQWAQEVGKLRGCDVRISCVCVDTATTRNDLETATRHYWERLCSDLRVEASSRLMAIVEFLSFASKELERRPRDVEEVGLAHEAHARIEQQSAGIAEEMEVVAVLAKVMAAWTSEKLDGVNAAHAAWQELGDRLEKHKAVMTRLLEDAKVNLRHRAIALRDERERWQVKWSARSESVTLDWLISMKERWLNLNMQMDFLKADCKRIALDLESVLEDDEINLSQLERELEIEESNYRFQSEFLEELKNQETEEWTVARRRLPRLHDWLDSWENKIRLQDNLEIDKLFDTFVGKKINEIRSTIESIQLLRGDEIANEHWTELIPILGLKVKNPQDITLGDLLACSEALKKNEDQVKEITKRAIAESGIRQALMDLEIWESTASLPLQESTDSRNMTILLVGDYGNLLAKIEELRLLLEGAKGTSGHERFASRAARCEAALSELEERIKVLSTVQRKWIYLDPVYGSGAAPNDSGRWSRADKEFRYLIGEVSRDPRVPSLRRLSLPALTNLKDLLDRCQKSLDEFLEEKRAAYPRLYFLSDEDLLELVSGSGRGLEAHLPKLYHGVGSVVKENNTLTAIVSPEGEMLKLPEAVDLAEPLPRWLNNLENGMKRALCQSLEKCLNDSSPDPSVYPTQILLLSERIEFTERCERALKEGRAALQKLVEFLETQRARYRGLEDAGDKLTALKARGLLLDTVYHLQVARTLSRIVATGENADWMWYKQLRSYRKNQGTYVVRCAGAELPYRFEYQGASIGLVRTPLTEKCFLALTQAMKLGLGGSPTGPAGTGKTESVKALASILGRLVLVFNCDEGMDTGSMKRILGGLAQAGAWGCFDEFNRLEEDTLSAVAMLVRPLQEALRNGSPEILLGDQKITLDPHCCIFITMNPAGSEYGGRRKLPDSLARLFRPISMAHPDKSDIVRTLLECAGFLEAITLGKRLVEALEIAGTMLSEQPHYDWGLRALKSVLDALHPIAGVDETTRLLISIRASTLPKLTETDTTKFLALLNDLFPKANPSLPVSAESESLIVALLKICETRGLTKEIANRSVQLNDLLKGRTGVAVVGPPGSGKTSIRLCLAEAMARLGEPVQQIVVYPGAVPRNRLLGHVNPRTREWKEGVLSSAVTSAGNSATWIIFNGDVEPEWAEALNSALDDNRLLTLPNGIGIRLGSGTRFIFETHKLADASPATVSRLGVLHLGSTRSTSLLAPWRLEQLSSTTAEIANAHLCSSIDETLKINVEGSSASGLMAAALCHLRKAQTFNQTTQALLLSLCGQVNDLQSRDDLAKFIYGSIDSWCPDPQKPSAVLYDRETDRLIPFSDTYESIDIDYGPVSISDRIRKALAATLPWIEDGHPLMIRGPEACGKNTLIDVALSRIKNHDTMIVVRGSSLYGPDDLVTRLRKACLRLDSSSQGRMYKPRSGSRVLLILEDMHLAAKNLQELVRELLQEEGFLEEDLEFSKISLTIICTADESTQLHPRLEALFATYYLEYPSQKNIAAILELHLRTSLKQIDYIMAESWITRMKPNILDSFRFASTQESSLNWTLKDIVSWARRLKYYPTPENEADITRYLLDIGQRLFCARLTPKALARWESLLISKDSEVKDFNNDVYVWKSANVGLYPLSEEQWREEIINAAARCAREGQPVQAPISSYLLETIAGLSWAVGCDFRGVILVGRPGAGRRTAVKLVATFSSLRLIESGPERGKAAIKSAVQAAGIESQPTLLLLEEYHAREETLAVLISAMVSRSEIPGLFTAEELDALVAPLADLARREDFQGTLEHYLYHRLRKYLRIAVILDSEEVESSRLLHLGLRHCALLGSSLGEWWSRESSLIKFAVQEGTLQLDEHEELPSGAKVMIDAHLRAPRHQRAPARFLALVHTWRHLRDTWSKEVEGKLQSLEAGIGKLREAGEQVAKLEDEVSRQRQELEVEKGRANAALEQITATMRGATSQRGEMTNLKTNTERESAELALRKADIESELGKVEPLVAQAAQAVAGISADALAEVRSLRAPPAPVRDVLEGVLRLMGIKDTSWNSMKTFLAKRGIKDEIRNWDARRSAPASLEAVAKLVKERPESFEEKTAKRASVAAAPLAAWVLANLQYGQILEQVAPLEREQRQLAERLAAAEAQLGKLATGLNTVESRVAQLQQELAEHTRGAAELQLRTESTESSLSTARALLQKLDTEHRDWQTQFQELTARKEKLDIEAANAAALLVYQSPERDGNWTKSAITLLVTERERLLWRAQDLPADTSSLIAACRVLKGPLVPIFLDPSGVAVSWIKRNIGTRLEVTQPENSKFLTALELAVRFGKPLLVEELVEFPSILLPVLRRRPLRLGDRVLSAQQGFQLFLATRKDRLEDTPREADAVLCEITLGAGTKSLAERFVEKLLLNETPELEAQRREALEREEQLSGERDAARLDLLSQLATARGQDLLQESQGQGGLLSTLEATQSKAKEIALALEESRQSLNEASRRAKDHEKFAQFAANVYETIKGLTLLSPLYIISTEVYTDICLKAVRDDGSFAGEDRREKRESNRSLIEKRLITLTFHHCAKAIYRKHRLPLALHMALSLNPVSDVERNLLLDSGAINNDNLDFELPEWIPDERREAVQALGSSLPDVAAKMKSSWLKNISNIYADSELNAFQRVLVVKALRPDYLHTALSKLAAKQLGVKDLAPPAWTLNAIAQEKERSYPVLLLLSPGTDPGPELSVLAAKYASAGFTEVSLGQGHVIQAESALEAACRKGGWILLSNLQLALNWLPRLESMLRSPVCTVNKNPSTRIWLTTEECSGFYPGLAGLCLKLAYEPPEGVKRNMRKSLQQLRQTQSNDETAAAVLMLSWLHATLQERRNFIPQGWIRSYEWNESDLEAAYELVIKEMAKEKRSQQGDWQIGRGLLDVAVYGGRLQDAYDARALRSMIRDAWSRDIFEGQRKLGDVLKITDGDPMKSLESLDDTDSPKQYFGLPANANRAWERSAAEKALTYLKGILMKPFKNGEGNSNKLEKSKVQQDLKEVLDRQCSLTCDTSVISEQKRNPLQEFFADEVDLTRKLLHIVRTDLDASSFEDDETPEHWFTEWRSGPKNAIQFAKALLSKYETLKSSAMNIPSRVDLSQLSRPRALLTALKQHTARELGYPLEVLHLDANWIENRTNKEWKVSLQLEGLLISGASIEKGVLKDLDVNSAAVAVAPICQVAFMPKEYSEDKSDDDNLNILEDRQDYLYIPVYTSVQRETLICSLPITCLREDRDTWFRRGVILYLR